MIKIRRTPDKYIYLFFFTLFVCFVTLTFVCFFRSIKHSDDLKEDLLACGTMFIASSYGLYETTTCMITTWRTFEITNSEIVVNYGLFKRYYSWDIFPNRYVLNLITSFHAGGNMEERFYIFSNKPINIETAKKELRKFYLHPFSYLSFHHTVQIEKDFQEILPDLEMKYIY